MAPMKHDDKVGREPSVLYFATKVNTIRLKVDVTHMEMASIIITFELSLLIDHKVDGNK